MPDEVIPPPPNTTTTTVVNTVTESTLPPEKEPLPEGIYYEVEKGSHKVSVFDNTNKSSFYPYKATCTTCPWEGVFRELQNAKNTADHHVETRYRLETVNR